MNFEQFNPENAGVEKKEEEVEPGPASKKTGAGKKLLTWAAIGGIVGGVNLTPDTDLETHKDGAKTEAIDPDFIKARDSARSNSFNALNTPEIGENYFRNFTTTSEQNTGANLSTAQFGNIASHSNNLVLRGLNLGYQFTHDDGDAAKVKLSTLNDYGFSVDGIRPGYDMIPVGQIKDFEASGSTKEEALQNALDNAARYYGILVNSNDAQKERTEDGANPSVSSTSEQNVSVVFNTPIKQFVIKEVKENEDKVTVSIGVQPGKIVESEVLKVKKD